jgi:hypothetical protein
MDQVPYWMRLFFPWRLLYLETSCNTLCEIEILPPRRIHTRGNLDPEVAIPVSDPENIVHKRK